jgi:hypothetical protein
VVRGLLAAAPPAGEARRNFVRNLIRGIEEAEEGSDNVFSLARDLLMVRV